jgi:uncharacterized protein
MTPDVRRVLSDLKCELEALYGPALARVVLYGSQARGDATEDSDIDVLLVLKAPFERSAEMRRTSGVVAALSLKHDTLISRQFVSESDYERSRTPLLINVRREGVPL